MNTRRNVFLWTLYDFANSIILVVFFLYFAQWVVIERGVSDFRFNLTFTVSAILLLLTAPLFGVLLDKSIRRLDALRISTLLTVAAYGLATWSVLTDNEIYALIFFTFGVYFYMLAFSFYTPLLREIAPPEVRGRVSGYGIFANYLGQFAGLAMALPFANGTLSFFGASPRAETLLPAVALFFLLSLPTLIFFKEPRRPAQVINLRLEVIETFRLSKSLLLEKSVGFFLLTFFFFNDAILTSVNNFPIFLGQVWQLSDTTKTYLLLSIVITCALGGLIAGFLSDRFGHKRSLRFILFGWLLLFPLVGLITNFFAFVVAVIFMGLWFGAVWAVARSVLTYIAPKELHNLAFSYFSIAERASSLLGPLVWGAIVTGLFSMGSIRYRVAIISMTIFILASVYTLRNVADDRQNSP